MAEKTSVNNEFQISTTWVIEEGKDLKNSVTVNTLNKSVEFDEIVQLETCVHLIQENKEPCTLKISIPETSSQLISQIVLVSEARIVELFGSCEEYLSTCTADYVDDFEDCAVYMAECKIKPVKELLIKFQKAKHPDKLWLYGVNLTMCSSQSSFSPFSTINFQAVNDMLKDTKIPISENAEKCKTFLQAYCSAQNQNQPFFKSKPPNPQLLMKMFESEYFNPISERGKTVSKCFSNFVPFLSRSPESDPTPDTEIGLNNGGQTSEIQCLKNYIDKRFIELENKIEKEMRELERRQNEKLDKIIDLLSKKIS